MTVRRAPVAALIGTALTVAACVLTGFSPHSWEAAEPFVSTGDIGQTIETPRQAVRVDDVVVTTEVLSDGEPMAGTWVAVRATLAAVTTEQSALVGLTRVLVDGRIYHASTNVRDTLRGEPLRVGTGLTGWIVIEVADDVDLSDFTVQFGDDMLTRLRGTAVSVRVIDAPTVPSVDVTVPELTEAP